MTDSLLTTEKAPHQLVNDFMAFAGYVETHSLELTKTKQWLSRKDLMGLNVLMSKPEGDLSASSDQDLYPLLHLLYHLGLAARLFRKVPIKNGKNSLKETERLALFYDMNRTEQYVCLLETFWVDVEWEDLQYKERFAPGWGLSSLFEAILQFPQGHAIAVKNKFGFDQLPLFNSRWNYFILYFTIFGFWEVTEDKAHLDHSRKLYLAKTITPTRLLHHLGPVLIEARNIEEWNVHLLREAGEEYEDAMFIKAFLPLFPEGELVQTLPRLTGVFFEGTYDLLIRLRPNCWRTIRISAYFTLHDLHLSIQDAFDFGNDHLYAFFMDGRKWSKNAFYSPDDQEQPSADAAMLGGLNLEEGQNMMYLFDYGDEWEFQVIVEKLVDINTKGNNPRVLKSKGEAPEQYGW